MTALVIRRGKGTDLLAVSIGKAEIATRNALYLDVISHTLLDRGRDEPWVEKELVDLHGHGGRGRW